MKSQRCDSHSRVGISALTKKRKNKENRENPDKEYKEKEKIGIGWKEKSIGREKCRNFEKNTGKEKWRNFEKRIEVQEFRKKNIGI